MDEAQRKRRMSTNAMESRRGRVVTTPFASRIHALQIRAAFIRGRLGSIGRPEIIDAAQQDLELLSADFEKVSLAFEEASAADTGNPRVLEMRRTLDRIGDQLIRMRDDPLAVDPFSFFPYPASSVGSAG